MYIRFPMLIALSVLFAAPVVARGQTTDEARALAGKMLPADEAPRPVPPGTIAQTTDDARNLAGRTLPRSQEASPRVIQAIGSTDEARAVAGGLLVVAPARHEAVTMAARRQRR
jgi:hypothetical protein